MKLLPAFWGCLLLWSCNARQCGERREPAGADTLMMAEQWQGVIHAVTCQEIEVRISLSHRGNSDSGSYQMMQRCKDNNNTFTDEGEWRIRTGKDTLYILRGRNGQDARYYKVKGNRLFELDADKNEVSTYYLEKVQ